MTRTIRIVLALTAILALSAVPAAAHKSGHGHKGGDAPHWKSKDRGGKWHGKRHHHRRGVTLFKSGTTTLELDAGTAGALTGAGFALAPVAPATASGTTFSFPITKGRVQFRTWGWRLKAFIDHSGGITFTKGAVSVTASEPRIKLARHGKVRVVAKIGAERVRLLDLKDVVIAGGKGTANATLAKAAATRLNAAFGVTLFTPGLAMGKVTVAPGS
jgi:hypothetical protein